MVPCSVKEGERLETKKAEAIGTGWQQEQSLFFTQGRATATPVRRPSWLPVPNLWPGVVITPGGSHEEALSGLAVTSVPTPTRGRVSARS